MKKFLSLVLALVMTMSLVTISAGAKEFTDDDAITYDEAINVISTIGVVDGYADGSFRPNDVLTRGAAAKIICNLILGPTTAAELHATTAPYKDVPTTNTFAGYIAYCAKEGIISGYADGTFRPSGTLTGYAFMKMLLGALGYDAEIEGYTGANWSINVAKQAINIGLNDSLVNDFNGIQAVTRQEACLYAFNTLKADLVEYDTTISATINGQMVTIGNSLAKAQTWNNSATRKTNIKDDNYIQFAEQYFPKLVLTEDIDVFGRPDREWEFEGKDVGTYVNYDLLEAEYTEKVTGLDLYSLLGKTTIEDYDTTIYIDGISDRNVDKVEDTSVAHINKNNKAAFGDTGDGVLTQVFVDSDSKDVTIAIINTYLAIASSDYSEKKESATFDVYGLSKVTPNGSPEYIKTLTKEEDKVSLTASIDDFDVEGVEEDDAYLVNVADGEIQILTPAEVVADAEITAFKIGSNVTADGTKYDYADTAEYDVEVLDQYTDTVVNLKDLTYNVYLDAYGYLIGVDLVEDADNYIFITGIDSSYSNLSNKNVDAAGIFLDGTMDTIKVDTTKSKGLDARRPDSNSATVNSWFTYTVSSDGVYTLKLIPSLNDSAANTPKSDANPGKTAQYAVQTPEKEIIDKKNVWLPGAPGTGEFAKVYGNDATVYLTASIKEIYTNIAGHDTDIIIDDVDSVTVGVKNANIEIWKDTSDEVGKVENTLAPYSATQSAGVYTLYKNNGYVIATVVVGEDAAASKNLVYAHTSKVELEEYDKSGDEWNWTRKVIFEGEEITIKEVGDALTYLDTMEQYHWYQVKYNANDEVISVQPVETALDIDTEFVNNIAKLDAAEDKEDVVLYSQYFENQQPSLSHNVLYVTETIKADNGFHVSDDVKVALIQYNKNEQKTTYYTGADELEDIIDTLNEKYGKYNYQISAIIEDGDATSVVIYDKTNTYETGDVNGKTEDFTWTANVFSNGLARVTVTANRPEYIADTTALNYSYDVLVNGVLYETVDHNYPGYASIPAGKSTDTNIWSNTSGYMWMPLDADDVVTVANLKFTNLNAQNYKLKVQDQDGNDLSKQLSLPNPTYWTVPANDTSRTFQFNSSLYTAGTFDIVKVTGATVTDELPVTGNYDGNAVIHLKADTTDYVVVTIDTTGLTKAAVTYEYKDATTKANGSTLTLGDLGVKDADDKDVVITLPTSETGIKEPTRKEFEVKVGATTNAAYEITIEKLGIYGLIANTTAGGTSKKAIVPVTGDIKIENKDIVVKELDKVQIDDVSWDATTLTIQFTGKMRSGVESAITVGTIADNATIESTNLNSSGNILTIIFQDGVLAVGDTLSITQASALDANGIKLDLGSPAKTTIKLEANGGYSLN